MKTIIEPFRIKVVEAIQMTTADERACFIEQSHYNLFGLDAENVLHRPPHRLWHIRHEHGPMGGDYAR